MPSPSAVAEISSTDVAWLKKLSKEGIGLWQKGNRPLTAEEFARIKKLISDHSLPVELLFDAHDVLFITIYVPPTVPGVAITSKDCVLGLAYDNFPGYSHDVSNREHKAFRDSADDQLMALAKNKRNRELLELYGLQIPR